MIKLYVKSNIKYFHLLRQFCHLLSLNLFLIVSAAYSISPAKKELPKETTDITFISTLLNLVGPGKNFSKDAKFPLDSFEVFQKKSDSHFIYVSYWQYKSYRYPLFVQSYNGVIVDFYLTFPSFMIHDRIHEYLIKIWGNQDFYKQSSLSAIYQWNKNSKFISIYEANCSITCFPVFLTMHQKNLPNKLQPLWFQFQSLQNKKPQKKSMQ